MIEYLVTGGAGFIGSNIAEFLVKNGKSVRIFDDFSSGKRENIESFAAKIEIFEGDLRDFDAVKRAARDVRFVLHVGAIPSVPRSVDDPKTSNEINITGTVNVLLAARDAKVERVVFSSSSSVYGDTPELPKRENMTPQPQSPYALQKLTGENYGRLFWQLYGLPTISLRYFNVFGPRQNPQSQYAAVIPRFVTAILKGEPPIVFGDGTQSRDFSHIENIIEANLAACNAPKEAVGEAFNIGCGERITLLQLIETIEKIVDKKAKPRFEPPRAGDVMHSQADISKAKRLLGWSPRVNFGEGIRKTVEWYRQTA
jgi:nucleoside-diphosphate-sugar epimerase